jgi:DNA-directed RNA polymerase specialized sigma24 family protein
MCRAPAGPYGPPVLEARIDRVFAAAHAACGDEERAAEVTRRVLVADPGGPTDTLAARAALLVADRRLDDAVVLARVLGWKTDRIAVQLHTTPQDVRGRIARGLRTLLPPRDCAGAASRARGAHAS